MAKSFKGASGKQIAKERVEILLARASEAKDSPDLSKRYVFLAREIAMKQRVHLKKTQKRMFCRGCGALLVPGRNERVRVQNGKVVLTCLECGKVCRVPVQKHVNREHELI